MTLIYIVKKKCVPPRWLLLINLSFFLQSRQLSSKNYCTIPILLRVEGPDDNF